MSVFSCLLISHLSLIICVYIYHQFFSLLIFLSFILCRNNVFRLMNDTFLLFIHFFNFLIFYNINLFLSFKLLCYSAIHDCFACFILSPPLLSHFPCPSSILFSPISSVFYSLFLPSFFFLFLFSRSFSSSF